ncbi:MAG: CPBP family intramembrane metalloprotease [Planctomycetia bacterium]|nr:CPBP family intramembrane metalloprotease [Planctomycetia bacterium]
MNFYWSSTRHPWPCLLFILPLLVIYEGSMLYQTMEGMQPYRAGIDQWLANLCKQNQMPAEYLPSLMIAVIGIGWAVVKWDRSPPESWTLVAGMFLESLALSLALWGLGVVVTSQLSHLSINTRTLQAVALMGSGIFEEILFRLLGFGLLYWLFKSVVQDRTALVLSLMISAFGFAAAHCLGPQGEAWEWKICLFRSMGGVYFGLLFHYRGLGIAVGTHCAYNVLVGLLG